MLKGQDQVENLLRCSPAEAKCYRIDWLKNLLKELQASKGHPHAANMMEYAKDAAVMAEPWKNWQIKSNGGCWNDARHSLAWALNMEYRRKPVRYTITIDGEEFDAPNLKPENGQKVFTAGSAFWFNSEMEGHKMLAAQGRIFNTQEAANAVETALNNLRLQTPKVSA